ncbi:ABC transporter substrate-binding protein, partial [Rhizobium ruizarguesonis]
VGRTLTCLKKTKISWGITKLPIGPDAKGPGTLLITDSLAIFKGSGVEDKATEFAKLIIEFWKPLIDGISYGGPEPIFTDYK